MADNEIVYEVTAKTQPIEKSLKRIDKAVKELDSKEGGFGKLDESIKGLGTAAIATGAAIATYLVGQGLRSSISAAIETEDGIARLNNALANTGRLSAESSSDLISFASQIQNTTKFSDDAAMSMLALATSFTKTNEQSKELTLTAINMSAQFGVSAETLVRQLGGALNGTIGGLARLVPELRNFTDEQLKAGKAVEYLSQRFAGAGIAAANTFSGRITQLGNAFGDLTEEIGFFFTKSKTLNFIFDSAKKKVIEITNEISLFRTKSGDVWEPILRGMLTFGQYAIIAVFPFFEVINNALTKLRQGLVSTGEIFVAFFSGDYGRALRVAEEGMTSFLNVSDIWQIAGTNAGVSYLEGLKEQISLNAGSISDAIPEDIKGGNLTLKPEAIAETLESLDLVTFAYVNMFDKVTSKMEAFRVNQDKLKENLKKGLFTTMVNGVQGAMNAVGAALVNGGNAFEAFGKALLSMFGQMATQLGMFYFLLGLATVYNDPARGAGMIAGGLALMVFGGVLSALAGGGGGASAGGATSGGGASGTAGEVGDSTVAQNETEDRQRATNIEVVVQGNVVGDKREFGIMIAESINEAFGNDGIILARGAVS
jgi:hypothetical protein